MPDISKDPNMFAKQSYQKLGTGESTIFVVGGYQAYDLKRHGIDIGGETRIKQRLIDSDMFLKGESFESKSVLDLGCNSGALSLWACQKAASEVHAVDMDGSCITLLEDVQKEYGLSNLHTHHQDLTEVPPFKYDYVFALALIHWVYSCTSAFGSLNEVMKWLSERTRRVCYLEWIDPTDSACTNFKHIEYNPECIKEPFNLEEFEKAGKANFEYFGPVGDVRGSARVMYHGRNFKD